MREYQGVLLDLAENHLETLIPGYTHLQRAQPLSLAHHLLAYFQMAQRDGERLEEIYKRTNICPLGSGALAGLLFPLTVIIARLCCILRGFALTVWMG